MYSSLIEQFHLQENEEVFPAKCPVYCWRTNVRFKKFSRYFDGYEGTNALGYTRSIEKNGHVHVVIVRPGKTDYDFDRFASTLVHEGTHAFLHRLYSNRLIPHWINEGLADFVSERVLGDRSVNGENATLLSRPYVRYDWPISDMLHSTQPIGVEQYPLAHSLVDYLISLGDDRFVGFIKDLKQGQTVLASLAENYEGLTLEQLDVQWRNAVRTLESASRSDDTASIFPQVTNH